MVKAVPLTCHGHARPVTHLSFSDIVDDNQFYLVSACKGTRIGSFAGKRKMLISLDNTPMIRDGVTGDWCVEIIDLRCHC